jgi:hypothetical protein
MEEFDLNFDSMEPIKLNIGDDLSSSSGPSVNFGSGIELLMNDKKKMATSMANNNLGDFDSLENELNELSGTKGEGGSGSKVFSGFGSSFSNMFGLGGGTGGGGGGEGTKSINLGGQNESSDSNIGSATADNFTNQSTWDGFTKVSEVPMTSSQPKMNDREKRRKKRAMIKKLEEWYDKGLTKTNSHFTMESSFEEIEDEYETVLEEKRKKDSIKLQGWWFMTFVNSVEYANAAFNPFDINLDGWGEQVNEDIDSYEEIFAELHEKYKGGKISPEISLLLRLGFSAAVVNFTNKALSSATPGFNDVIKQSPELMKMFTNATVSSMSQQSPGFAMANNLMNESRPSMPQGPPPAPVETKNLPSQPRPGHMQFTQHPGNRPDLTMARGISGAERPPSSFNGTNGVDINAPYQPIHTPSAQPSAMSANMMRPPSQFNPPLNESAPIQRRAEMRGPQSSDIDNILSGLKLKREPEAPVFTQEEPISLGDDSVISISSLKDIQNASIPKKSKRKQKSEKNVISLDI